LARNRCFRIGHRGLAVAVTAAVALLGLLGACSQNYEAGSHPPPKPPQRPRSVPADHPQVKPAARTAGGLSGTIRIAPELAGKIPTKAYLYVMAREDPDGGIPFALKRIPVPQFPYSYSLSQADVMGMGEEGVVLADVAKLYIVARIDQDGLAGVSPGDMEGACEANPVSGSGQDLDILIDTVH
jgi:cytochrome c-type biogenesis protein CcmH